MIDTGSRLSVVDGWYRFPTYHKLLKECFCKIFAFFRCNSGPGQAARDILHAMSYAPTHESFSSDETQHITPISKLFKSPRLKSKSSSLVSLIGPVSPRMTRASGSTCSLVQLPISSSFSPNHPSNNCENSCLLMSHPPVIHPPPDLVQMTASSLPSQSVRLMSSDITHQSNLEMIRESSPYKPF